VSSTHTGHKTSRLGRYLVAEEGYVVLESMRWRTPPALIDAWCKHLGIREFDLDACADAESTVARRWFSAAVSCLTHGWGSARYAWMNPPFGGPGKPKKKLREAGLDPDEFSAFPGVDAFVDRAIHQVVTHQLTAVVHVPAILEARTSPWVRAADELVILGRVRHLDLDGDEQRSPPGPHMGLVFRPGCFSTPTRIVQGLPGFGRPT
jgi:hypothetical protein